MKFALLSHALPPTWSGQAMVLSRLLHGLDHGTYCLASRFDYDKVWDAGGGSYTTRPSARYYCLPARFYRHQGLRVGWGRGVVAIVQAFCGILGRGRRLAAIVKREGCDAIIGCSGDLLDLPTAYVASRLAEVRFYAYIFDDYRYQWIQPVDRWLARLLEPVVLRGSDGVIVLSEALRDDLRRRHQVECTVIHNPCEVSVYEEAGQARPAARGEEVRIVFTGAVYDAHYDAFRNLLAAMELTQRAKARLHVYTAIEPSSLEARGIRGRVTFHAHLALAEMPRIQCAADILFLPLAFHSPYPEVIRTSAPCKLSEYLASGRPILAHVPSDSFVAAYIRKHDCGLLVDSESPAKLAEAIDLLATDEALRRRLGANARERARVDFDVSVAQAKFAELLKMSLPASF